MEKLYLFKALLKMAGGGMHPPHPPPLDPPMEAEVAKQKYISVLVGSLDAPNQTFLVNCHPLDSGRNVNSSIILHTVDDILRQLETKRENFSLFLTDAARYMSSAGKTLKELYPSLMHVTCVAHLLHNCAMRVRAHFKNINEVIAKIARKNKQRSQERFS